MRSRLRSISIIGESWLRGHAVFVLHGPKLRGGFALQRTRPGPKPQWLLIKRRDDEARPDTDIVAEQPASVLSGRTLEELLGNGMGPPPSPLTSAGDTFERAMGWLWCGSDRTAADPGSMNTMP